MVREVMSCEGAGRKMAEIFLEARQVCGFRTAPGLERVEFKDVSFNQIAKCQTSRLHDAGGAQLLDLPLYRVGPRFRSGLCAECLAVPVAALAHDCAATAIAPSESGHLWSTPGAPTP